MLKKTGASLEAKLCLLTVGILFVVLLGVGHLAMREQRTALLEQERESFDAVARSMALSASRLASNSDPEYMRAVSTQVRNARMNIEYVVVADQNGRTVYAESRNLPKKPYAPGMRWWMVVRRIMGYGGISEDDIYSVSIPAAIGPGKPGTLTAGFRLSAGNVMIDAVQTKVLLAICLGLLVGIGCAIMMAHSLAGALRSLTQGVKAVATGDFTSRARVKTGDEIGQLGNAFNYMVESLSSSHDQLVERANTDSLTGLYNHRYFQERLAVELSRAARYGHRLSLLMVDIDFFKSFNDTHGHPMGDIALRELAYVLMQQVRDVDIVARIGGEEFAIILPETSIEEAIVTAERVKKATEEQGFHDSNGEETPLTVSVGAAGYPDNASDRSGLILASDVALYQAKNAGRNRVCSYTADMVDLLHSDHGKLYVLLHAHDMTTIQALAEAIDAKLKLPSGHSKAVAELSSATARTMGISEPECMGIYLAALLRDIGQIAIPVRDLDQAIPFYRDVLGMRFLFQAPPGLAFFDCEGVRLLLDVPIKSQTENHSSIIYFSVPDLKLTFETLTARGVKFDEPPNLVAKFPDYELWMAFFRDPDSNLLALMSEIRA